MTTPTQTIPASTSEAGDTRGSIAVVLTFNVDLWLLRRQKRALINLRQNLPITADQENAVEGILNMIDFIQNSIVDQGLASEAQVFPQMSLPFATAA